MTSASTDTGRPPLRLSGEEEVVRPKVNLTMKEDEKFRAMARGAGLSYANFLATLVRRGAHASESSTEAAVGQKLDTPSSELCLMIKELNQRFSKDPHKSGTHEDKQLQDQFRNIVAIEIEEAAKRNSASTRVMLALMWPMILGLLAIGFALGWMSH